MIPIPVPGLAAAITLGELLPTLPFVVLLLAIAVLPLVPALHHWWEENRNKLIVSGVLAAVTLAWFAWRADPDHPLGTVLDHAVAGEYVPFMVLLFSLYTICGGIRISGKVLGTPLVNTLLLTIGTAGASLVGTTGASMLLIRPLLDFNSSRRHVVHTVVFFIFLVSNIGGTLLPIGDPPLFLGYLYGVPFLWTLNLAGPWLFCVGTLLAVYYVWDCIAFRREAKHKAWSDTGLGGQLYFRGMQNLIWLGLVVLAVATIDGGPHPVRPIPGTDRVFPFLRELLLLGLTAGAWLTTDAKIREQNRFNFAPIGEVAALFIGIFITMQPALELLQHHGAELGVKSPQQFFWATGVLSSFLDNAPTYAVFFQTALSLQGGSLEELVSGAGAPLLAAVSIGAVFMGANTYIGNGPNFMVKSIAEQHKVPMPGFFAYMMYSGAILIPLFAVVSVLFL
jgi:Na+/H+ antiporter NhaD/arsenite permease-like protein